MLSLETLIGINLAGLFADRYFRQNCLDKMLIFPIICLFGEIIGYLLLVYIPQYPLTVGQTYTNPLDVQITFRCFGSLLLSLIFVFCLEPESALSLGWLALTLIYRNIVALWQHYMI